MATVHEKVAVYESLLHAIQMAREVTMDERRLARLLNQICTWSYAHRSGNGEISQAEQKRRIEKAFKELGEP